MASDSAAITYAPSQTLGFCIHSKAGIILGDLLGSYMALTTATAPIGYSSGHLGTAVPLGHEAH